MSLILSKGEVDKYNEGFAHNGDLSAYVPYFSVLSSSWEPGRDSRGIYLCPGEGLYEYSSGRVEGETDIGRIAGYLRAALGTLPIHANLGQAFANLRFDAQPLYGLSALMPCGCTGIGAQGQIGILILELDNRCGFVLFTDRIALYRNGV